MPLQTGGASHRPSLVSETHLHTQDDGDGCRSVHNPEVAGSNPAPATNVMPQDIEDTSNLHQVRGVFFFGPVTVRWAGSPGMGRGSARGAVRPWRHR